MEKKRTVLISGGSSGLGLATTKEFLAKGDMVVVASRRRDKFEKNLADSTDNLIFIETDFSNMDSVKNLYKKIESKFSKLDIVINNVGTGTMKPITEITEEEFDYTINVNLKSLWIGLKHQLVLMKKDGNADKHIINVSSINGLGGAEYLSIYSAAKAGVISLTKTAALENANSNISINAIVPGPFETPMLDQALNVQSGGDAQKKIVIQQQYEQLIPKGRFGDPAEFAKAIVWLCEGNSKFISGHSLIMDGGLSSRFR